MSFSVLSVTSYNLNLSGTRTRTRNICGCRICRLFCPDSEQMKMNVFYNHYFTIIIREKIISLMSRHMACPLAVTLNECNTVFRIFFMLLSLSTLKRKSLHTTTRERACTFSCRFDFKTYESFFNQGKRLMFVGNCVKLRIKAARFTRTCKCRLYALIQISVVAR